MTARQKLELVEKLIEVVKNRRQAMHKTSKLCFFQVERNDAIDLQLILEEVANDCRSQLL